MAMPRPRCHGAAFQRLIGMTEAVNASKPTLAPLYSVLTDEQKKMADQLMPGPFGHGSHVTI